MIAYIRSSLLLFLALTSGCAHEARESRPRPVAVSMQIGSQQCGDKLAAGLSGDNPGPFSKWLKNGDTDGRLEVRVLVGDSAGNHGRPKTVRATVRGNLIEILITSGPYPGDELPPMCYWHVPYRFVIDGIESTNYLLLIATEVAGYYRARYSASVREPD